MGTAENAKIQYESGQDLVAFVALTDQGDHKDFRSADPLWSNRAGYEPDVKPNGLATGGVVGVAASGSDDVVDVAALTCYLAGLLTSVIAEADLAIARPTASHVKYSITITGAGAIAAIKGTESTSFSTTRGAAGGPPLILPDSIEIAQVWLSSATPAAITAGEIKQVVGGGNVVYDGPSIENVGAVTNRTIRIDIPPAHLHRLPVRVNRRGGRNRLPQRGGAGLQLGEGAWLDEWVLHARFFSPVASATSGKPVITQRLGQRSVDESPKRGFAGGGQSHPLEAPDNRDRRGAGRHGFHDSTAQETVFREGGKPLATHRQRHALVVVSDADNVLL